MYSLQSCKFFLLFLALKSLAFHGWMDYHTGVVELSTGKTAANGSGRSTAQLLKTTLFKNMKEGS